MRIFHLSDLHIGLRLYNRELYEDQMHVFKQIAAFAAEYKPDVIAVAGDIYDKAVPSAEAVELFDLFLRMLRENAPDAKLMLISGNHDSASRLNVFRSELKNGGIYMIGNPPMKPEEHIEKVTLEDEFGEVNFYLLPFVKPSFVKQITGTEDNGNNLSYDEAVRRLLARENIDTSVRNVIVSHQFYLPPEINPEDFERADSEIITVGNIDRICSDVLDPFDYAALGHIHKPAEVGRNTCRYCGTPIACSVSEAGQSKGVIMVELGVKAQVKTTLLPLTPLREIRIVKGTPEEVLKQACTDYVTAIVNIGGEEASTDLNDRLRAAFPYLLETRYEKSSREAQGTSFKAVRALNPFEIVCEFVQPRDEEETALLRDIVNSVTEDC